MSKVIIFGCGRGAEVAYRYLKADTKHDICGFTADSEYCRTKTFFDLPLVPFEKVETVFSPSKFKMFALMGYQQMNHLRAEKYFQAKNKGYSFISYIHSKINTVEPLSIGENCFIMENQSINLDVKIGNNVVMWSGNHIGDYSLIEDHVWISSLVSIAGNVEIGRYSFLGINASISNNIKIADETYIGASVFMTSDTVEKSVYTQPASKETFNDSVKFMELLKKMEKI